MMRTTLAAACCWLLTAAAAAAQSPTVPPPAAVAAPPVASVAPTGIAANDPVRMVTVNDGVTLPVFGGNLFSGAFAGARPSQAQNYTVQPGDQVAVRFYGATSSDSVQTIDSLGRLFVQGVGPVDVNGVQAPQLQAKVAAAVRAIYNDSVGVYVSVLQGGTLGVYLSGDVVRPGRYLGASSDNVLYFLDQAGGVDAKRGSLRDITIRRGGAVVGRYDLYDFLLEGRIDPFRFEDGDVIFIGKRGPMAAVTGDVANSFAFEAPPGSEGFRGDELMRLARPSSSATAVGVTKVEGNSRLAATYPVAQFANTIVGGGQHIDIRSQVYTEQITVSIQGDLRGPRAFVLNRDATLSTLLAQVPLDGADVVREYVHIKRRSVAAAQKVALDQALDDLEKAVITTPQQSQGLPIAAVTAFVAKAKGIQPPGIVAVYSGGRFNDIALETGDVVVFPSRSDVVLVGGEVLSAGAFAHSGRMSVKDYINEAGGFAQNADRRRFILQRPDGRALSVGGGAKPKPGDQIVVSPYFGQTLFQKIKDITSVVFQGATTAVVLNRATQ